MRNRTRSLPVTPTTALDHAVAALARNDAEACMRRAVPALDDVGAGAPALDLVARAAVALGAPDVARLAFAAAARALAAQGMAAHAVAAALSLGRLGGAGDLLPVLAGVFGAGVDRAALAPVPPPPLVSVDVNALLDTLSRAELLAHARTAIAAAEQALPPVLPVRSAHPLWASLPAGSFERFARALQVRVCAEGQRVIAEGDRDESLFVVCRGEVRVERGAGDGAVELAVLGAEAVFGEMALLTAAPRAASVTTTRPAILLEAPRAALAEAVREVPALGAELTAWSQRRLVENLLRTSPLLRGVPAAERDALAGRFEPRTFAAGEVLLAQGAQAPGLFLLAAGRVEVRRREASGEDLVVTTVGAGSCVGEGSLVLRRPANTTVVALEPALCLVLRAERFMEVAHAHPALLASLYELAVQREEELLSVVAQEADDADELVIV